jgi:hypothetical protein
MRVNISEGYKVCAPKEQKGCAQGFNRVSTLGIRHSKMRPESGARMRRRANDFDPIWRARLWCPFRALFP